MGFRVGLAGVLQACVAASRRGHLSLAACRPFAGGGLCHRAARRHSSGAQRRAGGGRSGALPLRKRHVAQPCAHVAGQLLRACAQASLALRCRLDVRAFAGRRPRQQPPELAMGGRHWQPQALSVQCRQCGPLCAPCVAQPRHCGRRQLCSAGLNGARPVRRRSSRDAGPCLDRSARAGAAKRAAASLGRGRG